MLAQTQLSPSCSPFLFPFTSAPVSGSSSGGGVTTQPHFVAINTLVVWWSNCIRFLPLWQVKTNVSCHRMWWWSVLLPNKQEFPDYHEYLTESLRLCCSVCSLWPSWVNGFFFWVLTYIHARVSYCSCVHMLVCAILHASCWAERWKAPLCISACDSVHMSARLRFNATFCVLWQLFSSLS